MRRCPSSQRLASPWALSVFDEALFWTHLFGDDSCVRCELGNLGASKDQA